MAPKAYGSTEDPLALRLFAKKQFSGQSIDRFTKKIQCKYQSVNAGSTDH
jgi:hypothetical protein